MDETACHTGLCYFNIFENKKGKRSVNPETGMVFGATL